MVQANFGWTKLILPVCFIFIYKNEKKKKKKKKREHIYSLRTAKMHIIFGPTLTLKSLHPSN